MELAQRGAEGGAHTAPGALPASLYRQPTIVMSTCAVISRVQFIEAPYLNEFVYWYVSLGFEKIYFINTEPEYTAGIQQMLAKELEEFIVFLSVDKSIQNEPEHYLLDYIKENVTEDYVLNADSDELLYIDASRFKCIQHFLDYYEADFYAFTIVNVPCFALFSYSMLDHLSAPASKAYFNETYKALGRVDKLRGLSWQAMNDGRGNRGIDARKDRCFLFHFVIRSVTHQLLKQYHQRMNNFKEKNGDRFQDFILADSAEQLGLAHYPFRILSIMVLDVLADRFDAKGQIRELIRELPRVPARYHADARVVRQDVVDMLGACLSDPGFREMDLDDSLDQLLCQQLGLGTKLDARLLSSFVSDLSATEKLRITLDTVYTRLQADSVA